MALADIAAGLEVTNEQRDRGVALVDDTGADLAERLRPFAAELPCDPDRAATLLETQAAGKSIEASGRAAGLAPIDAAKTLYRLGRDGVHPLAPRAREIVRDWLDARLSRTEAMELVGVGETEFALATFIETHDPIDGAREAVDGVLAARRTELDDRDLLAETMSDAGELGLR